MKYIGEENIPLYTDDENNFIDLIEELLPIVRVDEYLIIKDLLNDSELNLSDLVGYNSRVNINSLSNALEYLKDKNIIKDNKLNIANLSNIKNYLFDLVNYGLTRYEVEFGDFEGEYKLYSNYTKEQSMVSINKKFTMNIKLKGTYFDEDTKNTYIYVGLKKDKSKEIRTNCKDKFISQNIFQWESENNTTRTNSIGIKLQNSKKVFLFVRKMDEEDNVVLPFTYFGTGKFTNMRVSKVVDQETKNEFSTLLFDIELDNEVPEEYRLDFNVPTKETE